MCDVTCFVRAGVSLSTGALQWCRLADEQPFAVITASGTAYNGSYFIGVSSEDEVLPVEDTFFRGSFLRVNVSAPYSVAAADLVFCTKLVGSLLTMTCTVARRSKRVRPLLSWE